MNRREVGNNSRRLIDMSNLIDSEDSYLGRWIRLGI